MFQLSRLRAISLSSMALLTVISFALVNYVRQAPAPVDQLGVVHFKVSCTAVAQKEFNIAMAYYHSFGTTLIGPVLDRALQADPSCGMAHWARALSILDNPFGWPIIPAKAMTEGTAALEAARKTGLKSQRERDYVEALALLFVDHDKQAFRARAKAFESALELVAKRYPDDTEATVLHALVVSANFDPADKTFANQLRAARILEPIFQRQPNHPGVAHYLIHSYDYPPLAKYGLDAARKYAKIAPAAPHALHMPSHIFTLLGLWREAIASNRAAAAAATEWTHQGHHAREYMTYALLQLGEIDDARQVMKQQRAMSVFDHFGTAYPYASIPARIAIESDAWKEASELPLYAAETYPWKKYPQAEAVNAFARGIGSAMSGNPTGAYAEVKRLTELREATRGLKLNYWVDQVDIQADIVRGLAMFAEGKHDEGIAALRKAADREDATAKHVVTPGAVVPARELLATILSRHGKPVEALAEFEKVLEREPNRRRALSGAAQNAERAGDKGRAARYAEAVRAGGMKE